MSEKIPVWLDVDTGIDDAQAILAASRLPLDIRGISAVNGNVALAHTYENTRRVCALAGLNVLVYPGADRPLFRDTYTATHVHGADGLCGAPRPLRRGVPAAAGALHPPGHARGHRDPGRVLPGLHRGGSLR